LSFNKALYLHFFAADEAVTGSWQIAWKKVLKGLQCRSTCFFCVYTDRYLKPQPGMYINGIRNSIYLIDKGKYMLL
jgi:hypothetical protein